MKTDILSLTLDELQNEISAIGAEKFRAKQIFDWLHVKKITNFSQMSNISEQLQQNLTKYFCIKPLIIRKKLVSRHDYTVKYLYELEDGQKIETVLMRYRHANSLCVSTQAGCKMSCAFCASGANGFGRNLEPSEILSQIYETERDSGAEIGSLVLMGIGEPLDNFDNVIKFLKLLSDKNGRNMSLRHVSLSTCGLADKIDALAELRLGLTLSVSLHAADDATRSKLMPVNDVYNIDRLMSSCRNYFNKTGRRLSFEFALINGVNDSLETADKLIALVKPINAHINLIPVNPVIPGDTSVKSDAKSQTVSPLTPEGVPPPKRRGTSRPVINGGFAPAGTAVKKFQERLIKAGVNATVRRTLGADINAACGQLRGQDNDTDFA